MKRIMDQQAPENTDTAAFPKRAAQEDMPIRDWSIESAELIYEGFYSIERLKLRHRKFDGSMSRVFERERLRRGNVSAVILHDPERDAVALVEQFRHGAIHQDIGPWLLEVVAGMIESGEAADAVARREALEEAGVTVRDIHRVQHYLASPASTEEEVLIHYATCDLSDAGGCHGLPEEDEDIRVHVVSADEAIALLDSRRVRNAISIIALQWFRLWRAGLVTLPSGS